LEAEFWVAVAFVIFVGVLIYYGVHTMITGVLDQRSARIRADLDEARRLKEEAAALLAEYRRKQQSAEREAAQIVAGAKAEADRLGVEAKTRMEEFVARRTKMAETKIAQAEAQALADVRAAAAKPPLRRPKRSSLRPSRAASPMTSSTKASPTSSPS